MDNFYLSAIVRELSPEVLGRVVDRILLSNSSLLVDLRLSGRRLLMASLDRGAPALYVSKRASNEISRAGRTSSPFVSLISKQLIDAKLVKVSKTPLDRIVEISFERLEIDDSQTHSSVVLALTGRSANAYLIDEERSLIAAMFDHLLPEISSPAEVNEASRLTSGLEDSMSQHEIVDRFFGSGSIFGQQLKEEFLSRCAYQAPASAFRSLVSELLSASAPLLYSRYPLEVIRDRVINVKTDLLLSNIELNHARALIRRQFATLSEAADEYYFYRREAITLRSEYEQLRLRLSREINKLESALRRIESDQTRFGEPDRLKRRGDLILANLATARFDGATVTVVDYYDPSLRELQIDIPEGATLEEAATDYFNQYRKARRAVEAIATRRQEVTRRVDPLKQLLQRLENEPTRACIESVGEAVRKLLDRPARVSKREHKPGRKKQEDRVGRWFQSSDGYEIAVGRNDRDNDALTFRIARPYDIWLHTADYPGSHVVIRNPAREDVPQRTIAEAAALAAFNSQARREGKAAVHYAQRKFISKPPRSKPGLVRLSSFKTIMVEPRGDLKRLD